MSTDETTASAAEIGADVEAEISISKRLNDAINEQDWGLAARLFKQYPDECKQRHNNQYGWTKLHWLCSMGSTPSSLIGLVASIYPDAVSIQDNYIGDTCIHIICRNSQFSATKLRILLKYCNKETLLIRNRFGGTALHSASNHNAIIDVILLLIETNPAILHVITHEGIHAITALWLAFVQTIPGHMVVVKIINGEIDGTESNLFQRFWDKCQFLAVQYFKQSNTCPSQKKLLSSDDDDNNNNSNQYVLHGLLQCNVPINLIKVCLKYNAMSASVPDINGNLPLHLLIENRPYRLKEREAIQDCIRAYPNAALYCNNNHLLPLEIAIQNKIPYGNCMDILIEYNPLSITKRNITTGLYPYQLAALQGGKVSINTTYKLLLHQPDLVIK